MNAVHGRAQGAAIGTEFPRMRRAWGWILAYGILLIIIGAIAMFNPVGTNMAIGVLFGLMLGIAGIVSIVAGFRDFGWQSKLVDFLFGALALVGAQILALAWLVGLGLIFRGLLLAFVAFRVRALTKRLSGG